MIEEVQVPFERVLVGSHVARSRGLTAAVVATGG